MNHKLTLIIAFCLIGKFMIAQQNDLGEETVFTFGNRQLKLGDAFKINVSPTIYDSVVKIEEPSYLFVPKKIKTSYQIKPILPARLRVMEPLDKLQRVYVKAGMGMHTTPLLQVRVNQVRSKKSQVGVAFDHFSSEGGIESTIPTNFSNNEVEAWGKLLGKKLIAEAKIGYDRYVRNFYGILPVDGFSIVQEQDQLVNKIGGQMGLKSVFKDSSKVRFQSEVGFSNVTDKYQVNETNIMLNNNIGKFQGNEWYNLSVNANINQLSTFSNADSSEVAQNNGIVEITPTIISKGKKLTAQVGLSVQGDLYKTAKFYFYPNVELSYSLFQNIFVPYAGLSGGLTRNNWESSFKENPFVSSHLDLKNTNDKLMAYAGVKGAISSSTSFNLVLNNRKVENVALFVNDTLSTNGNRFNLIYDEGRILNVSGEINYHKGSKREVFVSGDWYDYGFSTENAWNLPTYKIGAGIRLLMYKKIKFATEFYYYGDRETKMVASKSFAATSSETVQNLKGFMDLNVNLEYRYSKRVSAFAQLNNLGNTNYQRWLGYAGMPLTVLGGFTFSF